MGPRRRRSRSLLARIGITGSNVTKVSLAAITATGLWQHGESAKRETNGRADGTLALVTYTMDRQETLAVELDRLKAEVRRLRARSRYVVAYSDTAFVGPPMAKRNRWWPFH